MANVNKSPSLCFTLPISCQICLGKVKSPVTCPNQHVFCSDCMEAWLHRNKQCPACRVEISRENPCRPILGGLSDNIEERNDDFACRDMRRTRMEMLFKDYETEIERVQRQNELFREEIKMLNERLSRSDPGIHHQAPLTSGDSKRIQLLTQKLEDAQQVCERFKKESKNIKEENRNMHELNGKLGIENKNLRIEMEHRSPRKFGRTAMAAMESRMEEYLKEITGLKKALARSDSYIEDLEKQVENSKSKMKVGTANGFGFDSTSSVYGEKTPDYKHSGITKSNTFDTNLEDSASLNKYSKKDGEDDDTFQLELPSPSVSGTKQFSKTQPQIASEFDQTADDTINLEGTNPEDTLEMPSPIAGVKKKLRFSDTEGITNSLSSVTAASSSLPDSLSSLLPHTQRALQGVVELKQGLPRSQMGEIGQNFSSGAPVIQSHHMNFASTEALFPVETRTRQSNWNELGLNIHTKASEKSSMSTSITPEMEDCMKIFEEAERKVEVRKEIASSSDYINKASSLVTSDSVARNANPISSSFLPANLLADSTRVEPSSLSRFYSDPSSSATQEFASSLPVSGFQNQPVNHQRGSYDNLSSSGAAVGGRLSNTFLSSANQMSSLPKGLFTYANSHLSQVNNLPVSMPPSSTLFGDTLAFTRSTSQQNLLTHPPNITSLASSLRMPSESGYMSDITSSGKPMSVLHFK